MYMNKIGKRIKKIREEKEITQQQLANYIDVDRTTLSHYESGARLPSIYILWKIADMFDISIDELIGRN